MPNTINNLQMGWFWHVCLLDNGSRLRIVQSQRDLFAAFFNLLLCVGVVVVLLCFYPNFAVDYQQNGLQFKHVLGMGLALLMFVLGLTSLIHHLCDREVLLIDRDAVTSHKRSGWSTDTVCMPLEQVGRIAFLPATEKTSDDRFVPCPQAKPVTLFFEHRENVEFIFFRPGEE